jgi:hypothetical protein
MSKPRKALPARYTHCCICACPCSIAAGSALCYGESNNLTVIAKPSLARASNFERSRRSRAGRVLKLFENSVLPGVLMYVHWRHFTHTKIRKARRTWSPSVGEYVSDGRFAPSPREARHTVYITILRTEKAIPKIPRAF